MNYRMIGYTLGQVLKFEAVFFAIPAIVAIRFFEWMELLSLVGAAALCLGIGVLLCWRKPADMKLYAKDGFVIVSLSWILLSVFGALPFVFSGAIPNYIDALFETVSGFTTTGSSILTGEAVDSFPHCLHMWRCFTHWVGGMGVLVFVMAILPLSGAQNMHIMRAESPGPEVSKLVPRVKRTAMILYLIYFVMTVITFVLLMLDNVFTPDAAQPMTVYDAACAAFGTAGTGGFGIKSDSIGSYSAYVQIVCTVFMLLFSINFNSYYLLLRLKIKEAFNSEVRVFLLIVFVAIGAISVNIFFEAMTSPAVLGATSFGEALRNAAFSVASVISTTGFATVDFNTWPEFSRTMLVLIMFVGACAGSTGGGMKVSRIIILVKGFIRELGDLIHPRRVKKITIDRKPVGSEVVRSVNAYLAAFVLIFVISIIFLSFDPYVCTTGSTLVTNFTAVTACMNNIGPGLDMAGPAGNYAFFSPLSKLVLIFDMLAGRLELFPMLILFAPSTWKKHS